MCSLGDDSDCDDCRSEARGEEEAPAGECRKCGAEGAAVVLRRRDRYCAPCFLAALAHKFRANFGRDRALLARESGRALLAHDGGLGGSALCALLRDALDEPSHKRLRLAPTVTVAHLDEGALRRDSAERRRVVDACGFPVARAPLGGCLPAGEARSLPEVLASIGDATRRRDFVKSLRRRSLLRMARESGCAYVLTADAASDLAADALVDVSLGAGAHVHCDVGFVDDRDRVKILRPVRDFTSEELEAYANIKNLPRPEPAFSAGDRFADVQSRIRSFVSELQADFPATVSTVLRTGAKLEKERRGDSDQKCILCLSSLESCGAAARELCYRCGGSGAVEASLRDFAL